MIWDGIGWYQIALHGIKQCWIVLDGVALLGLAWYGVVGLRCLGMKQDIMELVWDAMWMVWDGGGMVQLGMPWDGIGWYGMVWDGMGCYGMVWDGWNGV